MPSRLPSKAAEQTAKADDDVRQALSHELEEARYEALLAARRYEAVDPTKRLVARELETRWNTAPERVAHLEEQLKKHDAAAVLRPKVDGVALMSLAHDLPSVWNTPSTDTRTKQRIAHIIIREVLIDLDDATNEAVVTIHWHGGRHTELRVARVRTGRYPADRCPNPVEVIRKIGGHWPDYQVAVTMSRMRCKPADGKAWTTVRVRELREPLGIAPFDPASQAERTICIDKAACVWVSVLARSTSLYVRACFRPRNSFPQRHGKFRLPHLKPRPSRQAYRKSSRAVHEIIRFCKMIRP